eukprot:jgi/Tetstr1/443905/TSEL_031857.t1
MHEDAAHVEEEEEEEDASNSLEQRGATGIDSLTLRAISDRLLRFLRSTQENSSFDRLAKAFRGGYASSSDKFDYIFDHGGYLRSFDNRGPIYTCGRAWEVLHKVSKRIRLVIQRSVVDIEPTYIRQRKQYESRQTGLVEHVRMFLEHIFSDDLVGHVEIMPFHDGNNEIFKKHLPPWMTKICVYYYYKSWAEDDNAILRDMAAVSEVKLSSFGLWTWEEEFPDITTPKTVKPDMLLKYHLTCVKYGGYRPDDIYYYANIIPHDSSTTCTIIRITIMKVSSLLSSRQIRRGCPVAVD